MQPVHCSPSALAYSCIATAALPSYRQSGCPPQRLQTLPSAFGLLLQRSLALFLFLGSSQACLFSSYGLPKATLGILHRLQTLPRDFKPLQRLWPSCIAALPASGGPGERAWNVQPVLLWASKGDGRHFAPPSNPPPRLQTLPQRLWPTPAPQPCPLPLLGSSQACLFSSYGLPKATLGTLHRL